MEPDFANPIDFRDCPAALLTPGTSLGNNTAFLHCYNEMWRRAGVDKNAAYPKGSLLVSFAGKHL
jgi:hypothetical protein